MRVIFLAVALACAPLAQAYADQPSDWVKCDGYPRPEGAGTTAARLLAVISTAGLLGLPETTRYAPAARGQEGVDACTRALDTHAADNFWARQVTMLQARARHNIEAQHLDDALNDLRTAGALAQTQVPGAWYDRSLGVSATLLEAAILAKRGEQPRAEELALQAASARPYSATVQALALLIFAVTPSVSADELAVMDRAVSLNPNFSETRLLTLSWSEDRASAADEYDRALVSERAANATLGEPAATLARAALAAFHAGRDQRARELTTQLRAALAAPLPSPAAGAAPTQDALAVVQYGAKQRADALRLMPLIEAYDLARSGNRLAAFSALAGQSLPIEAASFDLLNEIADDPSLISQRAALQSAVASMRGNEQTRRKNAIEISRYADALPPLEQIAGGNRFRGRGWGANGYRDRESPGGGGRTITFSGGATITTTEELALLRAAQLARESGATGFIIRSRTDYQRYSVTTYAGVETSRAPSGFQIELDIRYADIAVPQPDFAHRVVDASAVWDELSPIFDPPRRR